MRALLALIMFTGVAMAQTPVNKSYPVTSGQKVSLRFDYPELVKISTWDKNEIAITGLVSINGGEHDEAFELEQSTANNTIYIENRVKNLKSLPKRITVIRGTERLTFKSEADYKKYCNETGSNFNVKSWGVDMDIVLEIKVPRGMETNLECVYGLAEVRDFFGPLTVAATYGGVDVAVQEKTTGELQAETGYGQIYTNLDLKFTGSQFKDFHTQVIAKPGTGPRYSFESKYGNVYLRKAL
ncbi:MAG: hypothetical protein KF763_20340 [Cyclobacteriaceae bacterium]|nr:hypothetical protein [Cyclobacteriaceae bacterium]